MSGSQKRQKLLPEAWERGYADAASFLITFASQQGDAIFSGPEDPGPRTRDLGPRDPQSMDPNWHTLYVCV